MKQSYFVSNIKEEVQLRMGNGVAGIPAITVGESLIDMDKKYGQCISHVDCNGIKYTYHDYFINSFKFAKSLIKLGLKRWDGVDLIGFNSFEYVCAYTGSIIAGGIATGIYATNSPAACLDAAKRSDCTFILVEGEKQLKKYLEIQPEFKPLACIIYSHENCEKPKNAEFPIYYYEEFLELGTNDISDTAIYDSIKSQKPNQCCAIIFTSGTVSLPKAVLISHDNGLWTAVTCVYSCLDVRSEEERDKYELLRFVSYLPLSHIAAQIVDIYVPLRQKSEVWFARPDALKGSLVQTLKACHPIFHMGVPRVWEKIKDQIYNTFKNSNGIKKSLIEWAKSKGHIQSQNLQYGAVHQPVNCLGMADSLLFSKIKQNLGFEYMVTGISSAAPILPEVIQFLADLDIRVYELLGQSEGSGPVATNSKQQWRIGTSGHACQGVDLKLIEETGEIIYYGRNVFMGYKDDEELTNTTGDSNGYVHTGDIGIIDKDGFVKVTGRMKDIIITAGGENIPPLYIEDKIKKIIPCISNCTLIGDKRKFLSMIMTLKTMSDTEGNPNDELSSETLQLLEQLGSKSKTVSEAINDSKLREYIDKQIDFYNKNLSISQAQNIRKWILLDHDYGLSSGELTPTLKMKRGVIEAKYNNLISKLYETL